MKRKLFLSAMCLMVCLPVFGDMKEDMLKYIQDKQQKEDTATKRDQDKKKMEESAAKRECAKLVESPGSRSNEGERFADSDFTSPEAKKHFFASISGATSSEIAEAVMCAKPGTAARSHAEKVLAVFSMKEKRNNPEKSKQEKSSGVVVGYATSGGERLHKIQSCGGGNSVAVYSNDRNANLPKCKKCW